MKHILPSYCFLQSFEWVHFEESQSGEQEGSTGAAGDYSGNLYANSTLNYVHYIYV